MSAWRSSAWSRFAKTTTPRCSLGDEPDDRDHPVNASGVEGDELAAVVLEEPSLAVRLEARVRELGRRIELFFIDENVRREEVGVASRGEHALASRRALSRRNRIQIAMSDTLEYIAPAGPMLSVS